VIPGLGSLRLELFSVPYCALTRETGSTKRITVISDNETTHIFSVDRDGAIKICSDTSGLLSCFPFMTVEEKLFVGGQNFTEGTNQYGEEDINYQDYYAYTIRGNDIVKLGAIESIPFKEKQPILVSKNRILLVENNHLLLVVF
jgi:hypothetical protein